eukprot:scaffold3026_cov221-Pinguiococcus_pyrenoidosus.AAC.7
MQVGGAGGRRQHNLSPCARTHSQKHCPSVTQPCSGREEEAVRIKRRGQGLAQGTRDEPQAETVSACASRWKQAHSRPAALEARCCPRQATQLGAWAFIGDMGHGLSGLGAEAAIVHSSWLRSDIALCAGRKQKPLPSRRPLAFFSVPVPLRMRLEP